MSTGLLSSGKYIHSTACLSPEHSACIQRCCHINISPPNIEYGLGIHPAARRHPLHILHCGLCQELKNAMDRLWVSMLCTVVLRDASCLTHGKYNHDPSHVEVRIIFCGRIRLALTSTIVIYYAHCSTRAMKPTKSPAHKWS